MMTIENCIEWQYIPFFCQISQTLWIVDLWKWILRESIGYLVVCGWNWMSYGEGGDSQLFDFRTNGASKTHQRKIAVAATLEPFLAPKSTSNRKPRPATGRMLPFSACPTYSYRSLYTKFPLHKLVDDKKGLFTSLNAIYGQVSFTILKLLYGLTIYYQVNTLILTFILPFLFANKPEFINKTIIIIINKAL